ncbi:drug/metabolite transporter (DMT)-like permease [Anoxybacillus voinovskiensis]|uniref:Drug/metabolite transporter (DMT)-like permease n=1 Tax=Anoxybacteroides voinovskiense TaxID=230470 RepID=A0A840DMB0_9BACL|nr:DMT family transporter [Anoxybacillus voinovskiensis]MBB4072805.1 drug/metabolite transporter (DMT)-like permease [Anoxybacillus voinovskiensis]GGJ65326.1 membrane protein [Anoxybacillus voinovskiensis]
MTKVWTYVSLVLVMIIWGGNVVAIKLLVNAFTPITITALRLFGAALTVFVVLAVMRQSFRLTARQMAAVFLVGLCNVVGHHYFLATGLTKTTASNAGIILGMSPLVTALFAAVLLRDRLRPLKLLGIVLGFTGVVFIVTHSSAKIGAVSIGDVYIVGAVLTQAISFIFIKKLAQTVDVVALTAWMLLMGSTILFLIGLATEQGGLGQLAKGSGSIWFVFFASAVVASGIGQMIYNRAIQRLGASEAAVFINLSPFFSLVASALFLGETIHLVQWFGFLFIVIGVLLASGALEELVLSSSRKQMTG